VKVKSEGEGDAADAEPELAVKIPESAEAKDCETKPLSET